MSGIRDACSGRMTQPADVRIGLFGGSFNPVHLAHLLVAQAAREELSLSRLYFIPAAQSPFKPGVELASGKDRLQLLRLALAGHSDCEVDGQELDRGGVSYAIDTVQDYAARFPSARIYYLVGADHIGQLHKWREAETLAGLAEFVAIPRPGQEVTTFPAPFRGQILHGVPLGVSSSQVRERVRAGLPIDLLVGAVVADAIRNKHLYL